MNINSATAATVVAAAFAIAVPLLLAVQFSRSQALYAESTKVLGYASDVLQRTEHTLDQIQEGTKKLIQAAASDPCSDANIALMRQIDISSGYIQAVGYVVDNKVVCSSLGDRNMNLSLGAPDLVTDKDVKLRYEVEFAFAPGQKFAVVERQGYAAIVHRNIAIDATTIEKDVSLAVFTPVNRRILFSRGYVQMKWIDRLRDGWETTFTDDGYVVAVIRSRRWDSGAIAALPITYLEQRVRAFAMQLIPLGFLASIGLAIGAFFLARRQRGLPSAIRTALQRKEFFLAYQPVVDLRTNQWIGAEALIRWRSANGEFVRPDIFIPIAEESGLIGKITERVVQLISQDATDVFRQHPDFHIAINFSADDFASGRTVDFVRWLVNEMKISPRNLIAEATERGFLDANVARSVVKELRASGFKVAIDDFGTGYSSLSYLETFNVNYLKIDKSFVDKIGTESAASGVVEHIIEMAKSLNIEMIAEGVETETQAKYLREHGVQYAQGWLFGKPMPLADLNRQMGKSADNRPQSALHS